MIENNLLEQFVTFAKCGTLLKASEMLHITQPSLSRAMKKIEDEFGVSLFHRNNSKITLNETGKVAVEYAERALNANQEMIDHVISFDRSLHTIVVGSCAPLPVRELMPILQEHFAGMALTTAIVGDERLVDDLKSRRYQLVILHELPEDDAIVCQRYFEEQLYITVPQDHPLHDRQGVSFQDIDGNSILTSGSSGFWLELCKKKLPASNLLVQNSASVMTELVDASTLPVFNSDQMLARGYGVPGRVSIPIRDPEAHVAYYLACLDSDKKRFDPVFNSVRSMAIRER